MAERLQRYLARAGVASRRHAETLITAGRVTVNNQVVTTLGSKVEPGDLVTVDGKLVTPPEHASWFLLYKPAGVVTTLDDPLGRPTVRQFLGAVGTRVFPIGRLDWDAEGALLVTDDGAAAHRLLHPSFQVHRTYLAKVRGVPAPETLARLVDGIRLEDGPGRALEAVVFQPAARNTWLRITVAEGRPHLVKRLCAAIGHPVVRLFRPHQAGVSVAGMQPGELRPLRSDELRTVEAVAAGQPVPPMTLALPPRRHGRTGTDDDEAPPSIGPTPTAPRRSGAPPARGAPRHAGRGFQPRARATTPPGKGGRSSPRETRPGASGQPSPGQDRRPRFGAPRPAEGGPFERTGPRSGGSGQRGRWEGQRPRPVKPPGPRDGGRFGRPGTPFRGSGKPRPWQKHGRRSGSAGRAGGSDRPAPEIEHRGTTAGSLRAPRRPWSPGGGAPRRGAAEHHGAGYARRPGWKRPGRVHPPGRGPQRRGPPRPRGGGPRRPKR